MRHTGSDNPAHLRGRASNSWTRCEGLIKRFEEAWQQGAAPSIDDYLLAEEETRHALLIELVHVDQEFRLKAGEPVRTEDYLVRYPDLITDRSGVLELLAAEYGFRCRQEPELSLDEYRRRFPDFHEALLEHLQSTNPTVHGAPTNRPAGTVLKPPPAVPGYQVLGELGRGGMAIVYRAQDTRLGRTVALKLLPEEYTHDPDRLERFQREARTASALNHPHICTIHDLGEHEGRPFIVMEYIEGRTLGELIGQGTGIDTLAQLIAQVARALAVAHAAGVVHRDIKPENVMVRQDGYVKVLDFGLARQLPTLEESGLPAERRRTDPNVLLGTMAYMSPEQARGRVVESASDVFSLGIVLYQLATSLHPFEGDSPFGMLHAIATQLPVPPSRLNPEVPAALEALIEAMLQKDPRLRPTAVEVEAALSALADRSAAWPVRRIAPRATVGRSAEQAILRAGFGSALAGAGLLLCVAGEQGIGKTTLVEDFLSELDLGALPCRVARGHCSERLAGAEAYLPFLVALEGLLRGAGGESVARIMKVVAPTWYLQVAPLAATDPSLLRLTEEARTSSQQRMKRELGAFVQELARLGPLVLFIDDVHWADVSTVDLLAHLGRQCATMRVLLVLAYRPTELLLNNHPFQQVKLELQGRGVCREVVLGLLERSAVDTYLALAFPNHAFPPDFTDLIHARTEGSPLFMVDLLRYLRELGVIAQAGDRWELAEAVPDLQRELPESVRSMIRRKLDLLDEPERQLLTAASVQGNEFDSAVVARGLALEPAEVEERLEVIERVHGLVRRIREQEFPDRTLTLRYGFVHILYQNALYAALQPTRRATLSKALAEALLGHHGGRGAAVAAELAFLFEAGRDFARAAEYFQAAADHAARVFAHHEAATLARHGLRLLESLPPPPQRDDLELALQMTLGLQLQVTEGFASPEANHAYQRARELCRQMRDARPLYTVLWGLFIYYKVRSELATARELAGELYQLAHELGDPALTLQSHQAFAVTTLCLGEPKATRDHMERGEALYDPREHQAHTFLFGQDPGVACKAFGAVALWLLGYPDWAVRKSREATQLSHQLLQPSSQALALHFSAMVYQCRREPRAVLGCAELSVVISAEQGFSFWHAGGTVLRGWALAVDGNGTEGINMVRQGLEAWEATGSVTYQTYYLALLAEVLGQEGKTEEGLQVLDRALALVDWTDEGLFRPELYRLQGELHLRSGRADSGYLAEACFRKALAAARGQEAKSLELRAALSLARLAQKQGKQAEARPLLVEIYHWFTEGFETPDLREAREFLET